jgi:hypothetical protein
VRLDVDHLVLILSSRFLMAKLHMDMLASQNTVKGIQDALCNVPQGFDSAYDNAINRIRGQTEADKQLAENALSWVAYARRPLSATELCYALSISDPNLEPSALPEIDIVISVCAGMLRVDEASQVVRLLRE